MSEQPPIIFDTWISKSKFQVAEALWFVDDVGASIAVLGWHIIGEESAEGRGVSVSDGETRVWGNLWESDEGGEHDYSTGYQRPREVA